MACRTVQFLLTPPILYVTTRKSILLIFTQFGQTLQSQTDKRYTFYYDEAPIKYPSGKRGYLGLLSHKSNTKLRLGYDYSTKSGVVSLVAILKSSNGQPALLVINSNNDIQQTSALSLNEEVGKSRITKQTSESQVTRHLQPEESEESSVETKTVTPKRTKPKPLSPPPSQTIVEKPNDIINEFRMMSKSFADLAKALAPTTPTTPATPVTSVHSTPAPTTPLFNPMQFPWVYPQQMQLPTNFQLSNSKYDYKSQHRRSHYRSRSNRRRSRHSYSTSRSSSPSYSSSRSSSPERKRRHSKTKRRRSPSPSSSRSPSRHNDRRSKKPKRT